MASATSLITDEDFCCSICLDMFTKPVSIPCGHTFCHDCLTRHWARVNAVFQCPLCKEKFYSKPMLRVNIFVAEMAEKFRKIVENKSSTTAEQTGSGKVLCSQCTVPKSTAIKSCLVCFTSFCQTHLEPHLKIPSLKKHKLINPVFNLENRICKNHGEALEFFCRAYQLFLCKFCKNEEYKTHKIVTLEEEAQTRENQLGMEKDCMDQMIQARQQKILEIQCSLDASRNNAEEARSCSRHMVAAVVDYVRRSQSELTEVIDAKLKKKEKEAKEFIEELNAEIGEIKLKNLQLDKVLMMDDHFTFLESPLPLTVSPPHVRDWSGLTSNVDQFEIQEALTALETSITTKISHLCDPNFKEKQQYAVDVTFDPNTANPYLNVSEDRKQVTCGNRTRPVPHKPERFDSVLNILAKEGFSSGKFYYEVQVKGKTEWDLGVARESINRKGDIRLSPKNGYWTIWLRKGNELTANAGPAIVLNRRELPQKVGVFVDYEGVRFPSMMWRQELSSSPLWDALLLRSSFHSSCDIDGGKNSPPLIITPVAYN